MYDCHIAMCRLCDWDLWLRYMKHVPFVVVDEIISDVHAAKVGSIGVTVPWDLALFRYFHDIPRDALLTPATWHDYEVDAFTVGKVSLQQKIARRLYEQQILPYYLRFRHHFPKLEGFSATPPGQPQTAILTKGWYDVSLEVGLNHYDALSNRRGCCKAHFRPVSQIDSKWVNEADSLLLVRTVEDEAKAIADQALAAGKPLGFYLDDDLLNIHEYGPEFSYMAPDTKLHKNLRDMIAAADAVWTTSPHIEGTIRRHQQVNGVNVPPLNPRTVPHNGCMPATWLPADIVPRKKQSPLRIGYVGGGYRAEEFLRFWDAFERISAEFGERVVFEFWGLDPAKFPPLKSPVRYRPFTRSYFEYLHHLREAGFDVLVTPLLEHPRPRLGKAPCKYYETAVAGALGIYSDVPPYARLPKGVTCLKPENTSQAWYEALREVLTMPAEQFDLMRRRLLEHVREEFTEHAQIHLHEAAWHATRFHAGTRSVRWQDGRPRSALRPAFASLGRRRTPTLETAPAGPELRHRADCGPAPPVWPMNRPRGKSARTPSATAFNWSSLTTPVSRNRDLRPTSIRIRNGSRSACSRGAARRFVHSVTFIPSFGQVCSEMYVPHVMSVYQVEDAFQWPEEHRPFRHCDVIVSDSIRYAARWHELLGAEQRLPRVPTPESIFALGQERFLGSWSSGRGAWSKTAPLSLPGTVRVAPRRVPSGWLQTPYSPRCRGTFNRLTCRCRGTFNRLTCMCRGWLSPAPSRSASGNSRPFRRRPAWRRKASDFNSISSAIRISSPSTSRNAKM